MPPNPFRAAWSYLRGDDFKVTPPVESRAAVPGGDRLVVEHKIAFTPDTYSGGWPGSSSDLTAAIRGGVLVSGPGADLAYRAAAGGAADANSAVFACLRLLGTAYGEPPLRVYRGDAEGGEPKALVDHPLEELVAHPNPHMTWPDLGYWLQWAKHVTGNAYLQKVRSSAGNVVELWPLSPLYTFPVTTPEDRARGVFVSYYRRQLLAYQGSTLTGAPQVPVPTGQYVDIPAEDVVHFRMGLSDDDPRLGTSPLQRLWREIWGDDEAGRFAAELLGNAGVASLVVEPPLEAAAQWTDEAAVRVKERIRAEYGRGSRGAVGVLSPGAKLHQIGLTPEQLDLRGAHRFYEERVCAVTGVPAVLVGLGAGLERSIWNNFESARAAFTELTLTALWTADAATLTQQLLPDFAGVRRFRRAPFCRYDLTNVRALQEDEDKKYDRLTKSVLAGVTPPLQAQRDLGLPEMPELDGVLYVPNTVTPTPAIEVGKPPASAPPAQPLQDGTGDAAAGNNGQDGAQNGADGAAAGTDGASTDRAAKLARWRVLVRNGSIA